MFKVWLLKINHNYHKSYEPLANYFFPYIPIPEEGIATEVFFDAINVRSELETKLPHDVCSVVEVFI